MKFMSTFKFKDGKVPEAAKKFLEGGAPAPEGATILGRWHNSDLSGGFVLMETDNPQSTYDTAVEWNEMIDIQTVPVLEDEQIGPVLAKYYGS